jgi:hypothetical protein
MKEMIDAAKRINDILHECEDHGDNVDTTLNKISAIKVHGVVFPTLMLLEIIGKFAEGAEERNKSKFNTMDAEREVQNKYSDVAEKWNKTH